MLQMTTPTTMSAEEIIGIGSDIVDIERIRSSLKEHGKRFLDKLLTPKEQAYCLEYADPAPHIAGRFCAKEAIAKALGTGFGAKLSFHDLEILPDTAGRPHVTSPRPNTRLLLSISHCKEYATATAIAMTLE